MTIIKIDGMTPEDALGQANLELKLAQAQKSDAQGQLSSVPRHAAALAVFNAEKKVARIRAIIDENAKNLEDAAKPEINPDLKEKLRGVGERLISQFGEDIATPPNPVLPLAEAVRKAGEEADRLREKSRAARKAADEASKAFQAAGDRLHEARTALFEHLGGGEAFR